MLLGIPSYVCELSFELDVYLLDHTPLLVKTSMTNRPEYAVGCAPPVCFLALTVMDDGLYVPFFCITTAAFDIESSYTVDAMPLLPPTVYMTATLPSENVVVVLVQAYFVSVGATGVELHVPVGGVVPLSDN